MLSVSVRYSGIGRVPAVRSEEYRYCNPRTQNAHEAYSTSQTTNLTRSPTAVAVSPSGEKAIARTGPSPHSNAQRSGIAVSGRAFGSARTLGMSDTFHTFTTSSPPPVARSLPSAENARAKTPFL